MKEFLSKKSLQPLYALLILLFLICAAPIIRGPRGYGMDMYSFMKFFNSGNGVVLVFWMWLNIIVSVIFILLAVPVIKENAVKYLNPTGEALVRLISSGILLIFLFIAILALKKLAWGWGFGFVIILTLLLFTNVLLNSMDMLKK